LVTTTIGQRPECVSRPRAGEERAQSPKPEDAKEAIGRGVRAKRSKSGAVSFDVLEMEASRAPVQ
jgi:hypothetical protein